MTGTHAPCHAEQACHGWAAISLWHLSPNCSLCLQAPLILHPYCNKSDVITQAGSIIPRLKTFNNFPLHWEWNLNSSLWPLGFHLILYHASLVSLVSSHLYSYNITSSLNLPHLFLSSAASLATTCFVFCIYDSFVNTILLEHGHAHLFTY